MYIYKSFMNANTISQRVNDKAALLTAITHFFNFPFFIYQGPPVLSGGQFFLLKNPLNFF